MAEGTQRACDQSSSLGRNGRLGLSKRPFAGPRSNDAYAPRAAAGWSCIARAEIDPEQTLAPAGRGADSSRKAIGQRKTPDDIPAAGRFRESMREKLRGASRRC